MHSKKVADSFTIMTQMVMPNDTNPLGNLMGGNLLRWMDVACGICAQKHTNNHAVTVSVDNVSFKYPIKLGDIVTIQASVTRTFKTSMEIFVEVFKQNVAKGQVKIRANTAFFTFVALGSEGSTVPSPPVEPETERELTLYEGAVRRREIRLLFAKRIRPDQATGLKALFAEDDIV